MDLDTMVFEMGQLGLTEPFSCLRFQIHHDDWRVFNSASVVSKGWKAVDFDDSTWMTVKAAVMGNRSSATR